MATPAERVRILTNLARELQQCGPMYLATLLVSEAYGRACLETFVFDAGSLDDAALQVNARLRLLAPVRPPAPPPAPVPARRRSSKRLALEWALAERGFTL